MTRRLLLTGGAGMVGRNVLAHPLAAGWDIVAPTRSELDLRDRLAVKAFIKTARPDVVVHAAGRVGGIHTNAADPINFLVDNLDLGRNVIMGAFEADVPHLVNLATSCMYPKGLPGPLKEEDILSGRMEPTNEGYAIAKIMATRLCEYISREHADRAFKTLIPCNLYGPFDKFSPGDSHLVPAVIEKVVGAQRRGEQTVEIWGDGSARREFLYAGDLAGAIWRAADDILAIPQTMNIAVGQDHSILEYYQKVASLIDWKGTFTFNLDRLVGVKNKLCDVSRQTAWGWAPQTSLESGLAQTIGYYRATLTN